MRIERGLIFPGTDNVRNDRQNGTVLAASRCISVQTAYKLIHLSATGMRGHAMHGRLLPTMHKPTIDRLRLQYPARVAVRLKKQFVGKLPLYFEVC